eukprot:5988265-Pyramimonas_sp.AAC.1
MAEWAPAVCWCGSGRLAQTARAAVSRWGRGASAMARDVRMRPMSARRRCCSCSAARERWLSSLA